MEQLPFIDDLPFKNQKNVIFNSKQFNQQRTQMSPSPSPLESAASTRQVACFSATRAQKIFRSFPVRCFFKSEMVFQHV
jgi:hypothetical protein